MNTFRSRPSRQNWFRFAMKLGLLATDAALWSSVARMLSEHDDARDPVRPSERVSSRLQTRDLQIRRGWSHASTLFTGLGIGLGLGLVFAPMSGEQARLAIRDTAVTLKNRMDDVVDWVGRRPYRVGRRSTGTYAD
ncbi:MAG: hypothetical protein WCF26_15910 [Candidatus Sulfotelmatobacter sp.]